MMDPRIDRRVARTRDRLHQALRRLLNRKRYGTITVQAICREAGVGRSTFYANFKDKDDLRRHAVDALGRALAEAEPAGERPAFAFCETLFEHAAAHRRQLCTACKGHDGRSRVWAIVADRIQGELASGGGGPGERQARVSFYVGGLMGLFDWWLDEGAQRSPREMAALFRTLAVG